MTSASTSQVLPVASLPSGLILKMYALYETYYDGTTQARFEADLAQKTFAILMFVDAELVGFSTVAIDYFDAPDGPVRVLFSGDTIKDRKTWGDQILSRSFAELAGELYAQDRETPLYWLLISKGHRTYRYLGLFARHYFPQPAADDAQLRRLACAIASARFGTDFDPHSGVISFSESHGHLREALTDVPERIALSPEGAMFLSRNPGWRKGDELVCLTALHPHNLRSVVHAAFLQGMHKERQHARVA